ncbi:Isopenicillin N synthase-like [Trema orientale]|uniref:Isopenicillin N synthase-like n=1 Tax=Trema orientale TaxID=63057 RepID=A0A2P5CHW2_TREOI|nr:Isopenicillin N synthase-like [Trema orientale]PON60627.1 Isopenicillin N synthase-like [Trema orientale]
MLHELATKSLPPANNENRTSFDDDDDDDDDDDAAPSSFVWSNDRTKPYTHPVVMKGEEGVVRYSVLLSTFYNGTVNVAQELIDEQHHLPYKQLNHLRYLSSQLGQRSRVWRREKFSMTASRSWMRARRRGLRAMVASQFLGSGGIMDLG